MVILAVNDDLKLLGLRAALQHIERVPARPFTLRVESNMDSALSAVREARPDLVVLDVSTRSIDAWTFLDIMKGNVDTTSIPIIVFSRDDTAVQAERAYRLGANAFTPRLETEEAWHDVAGGFLTFWLSPVVRLPKPPSSL